MIYIKVFILSIILSTSIQKTYSQGIKVEYDIINNDFTNKLVLECSSNKSIYYMKKNEKDKNDSLKVPVSKNYITNEVFFKMYISQNNEWDVYDTLHNMYWELTKDTMIILNYKCNAAITFFKGRNYRAFYASEIPKSDGPYKFGGLPGLILNIDAEDGFIKYRATEVTLNHNSNNITNFTTNINHLSWNEYVKKYKTYIYEAIKIIKTKKMSAGDEMKMKIEQQEIFFPELQTGEGILIK